MSATLRAGCITLDGLHGEVPIQDEAARDRADARVSIRPQSLYLGTDVLGALPMGRVAVVSRTYLGEYWDYVVRPLGGGDTLKVHAPPSSVLEIGHESALSVDPRGVAVVS